MKTKFLKAKRSGGCLALALLGSVGSVQAQNLVQNGDFSQGHAGFSSDYAYESYNYSNYAATPQVVEGCYTVGPYVPPSYYDWWPFSTVSGGNSQMLIANGATKPLVAVWSQNLAVAPGTSYMISFYLAEISTANDVADIAVYLGTNQIGTALAPFEIDTWQYQSFFWNSGSSSNIQLSLIDLNTDAVENDFALDNISCVVSHPATRYVSQAGTNPTPPYTNWVTAATTIQDAVNVAEPGDSILVSNGVYPGGVTVASPLALTSVNGPQVTVINGGGTNQCVSMAAGASLTGFTLTNGSGGGLSCDASGVVSNCVVIGNSGAGANGGTLYNCTLSGNIGDGADSCILYNCALTGNSGWGTVGGTNYNCTVTGNAGGGVSGATLYNCIVYFNTALEGANYDSACALSYCCTTPLPPSGVGNIALDPQLASASLLSASSPCIGAGSAACASGTDIDGEAWANPPSIGCDEYHAGAVIGPLGVTIAADYTTVVPGFAVNLTAFIEGRTDLSVWDFGDGTVVSNHPYASHAWMAAGDYPVTLRASSDTYAGGVAASVTVHVVAQPHYYVAVNSTSPVAPYSSWATAATNLQDAVDAASVPGALVLVTNGAYVPVTVSTPLTLQSVNGPDVTVIDGGGAATCVYLTNNAVLVGFTLTNGYAAQGGGAYCESSSAVLSNCTLTGNHAGVSGGGAYGGTLINCTLTGNGANFFDPEAGDIGGSGGGAYGGTLNNCTLNSNGAGYGGGAYDCTLNNCTLTGNSVYESDDVVRGGGLGGGAYDCTLNNCTLTGNSAYGVPSFFIAVGGSGGGAYGGTLNDCTLNSNWAGDGGGAEMCTLNNSVVSGNTGGGADSSTLNNCTVTGNSGWGASSATLNNCIVCFNSDPNGGNYDPSSTLNYCCTTPLPTNGVGNISADPQLASESHLSAESPCIGAGSASFASGTDIDGDPWNNPPSIGCDEYHAGAVTGPLSGAIAADYTTVVKGFPVHFTAVIDGRTDLSVWDFGDGDVTVNEPYTSHAWTATGDYLVALWVFNDSYPEGVSATVTVHVVEGVYYVAASSGNPVAPYSSWATAATNVQDAVNVAPPSATIFVTNGTYAPVTVNTPLTVQSVDGPGVTIIDGGGASTCVYVTSGAVLGGFTLTNGFTYGNGGGVYCASVSAVLCNCVLTVNSVGPYGQGGGAYSGTLNNCTLTGNSADDGGGGACASILNNCKLTGNSADEGGGGYESTLNNCTLTGNWAGKGGGAYDCTLNNCIVYSNTATTGANYNQDQFSGILNYCCTTPDPGGGGNITNAPLFVDYADANLRLQSNSPCINSGNNAYVVGSTDLDGNPRIVGGTVDIGAYEDQTPVSMISYAWLQQHGLPINTNTDTRDLDATGMNVYEDWIAGLNPTNVLSVLRMLELSATNSPQGLVVSWQSVNNITYFLQRSTNLAAQPAFSTIQSNIVGQTGTTLYTDTNAVGSGPFFYRVGVGN